MSKLKGKAKARDSKKKRNQQKNNFFLRKKNLISEIIKYDDPILGVECESVLQGEDVNSIFKKMEQVLNATENGVGLAANQIGITRNIIIIKNDSKSKDIIKMINPEIISNSGKKKLGVEMCLSYPEVRGMIERYTWVKVQYFDENWKKHVVQYKEGDILGIIVQHEVEHLQNKHCQVYDWWKDPEGMKKKLEERFKSPEQEKQDIEDAELIRNTLENNQDRISIEDVKKELTIDDISLLPVQEKIVESIIEDVKREQVI